MTKPWTRSAAPLAGLIVGLVVGLGPALSACGDGSESGGDQGRGSAQVSTTQHNDADVAFATDMIQHHAQALAMVDLTVGRDLDPGLQRLAEDIRAAQGPEVETMTDWLVAWGEDIPETMRDHANAGHDGHDLGESMERLHADLPGMVPAADMETLQDAGDAEFAALWLRMMVEHHGGAVELARAEQSDGRYRAAVDLAGDLVASQSRQIDRMQGLLAS